MKSDLDKILINENLDEKDIITLLKIDKKEQLLKLFKKSTAVKEQYIGNTVHYRGLIEFSNICIKDCNYCGIRAKNNKVQRYDVSDKEILSAVSFAYENDYGSIVLQSGERQDEKFILRVDKLLKEMKKLTNNKIGITLSCGEQTTKTYQQWYNSGAHRYLLRIESSSNELYNKIHPEDEKHSFEKRYNALKALQEIGYQTGTGVMVGLPFQTYKNLAADLLFMKEFDIDMCGLGPYIEHEDTPLFQYNDLLIPLEERLLLTLKMIAILRIIMKDINIAAATALQAIDKLGREKAISIGANILMPNITPGKYRDDYALYQNKPCTKTEAFECKSCLDARMKLIKNDVGYGKWGDSLHYHNRKHN
jgi:biotin synthase